MDHSNQGEIKAKKGLVVIPGEVISSEDKGYMA